MQQRFVLKQTSNLVCDIYLPDEQQVGSIDSWGDGMRPAKTKFTWFSMSPWQGSQTGAGQHGSGQSGQVSQGAQEGAGVGDGHSGAGVGDAHSGGGGQSGQGSSHSDPIMAIPMLLA